MKRHEALAPLSREHHEALILAQLLKKGVPAYKGLPTDTAGKISYARQLYADKLRRHFLDEEKILEIVKGKNHLIDTISREIFNEHSILRKLFDSIDTAGVDSLDELAVILEQHIRKEERILFPLIQQHCDEDLLKKVTAVFG